MLKTVEFKELFQSAEWKNEKHVPVIEAEDAAAKDEYTRVRIVVGKEIPHPNIMEHHIVWVGLSFLPDGEKYPFEIGKTDFSAHGASIRGPNTSGVYTDYRAEFSFKTDKPGTLFSSLYCNIHGLWQSEKRLELK